MATVTVKRGDTGQVFSAQLTRGGVVFDLTGLTVSFILRNLADDTYIKEAATITDAVTGMVEYEPQATDIETVGKYRAEWEVEILPGKILTFPSDSYHELHIINDLDQ